MAGALRPGQAPQEHRGRRQCSLLRLGPRSEDLSTGWNLKYIVCKDGPESPWLAESRRAGWVLVSQDPSRLEATKGSGSGLKHEAPRLDWEEEEAGMLAGWDGTSDVVVRTCGGVGQPGRGTGAARMTGLHWEGKAGLWAERAWGLSRFWNQAWYQQQNTSGPGQGHLPGQSVETTAWQHSEGSQLRTAAATGTPLSLQGPSTSAISCCSPASRGGAA